MSGGLDNETETRKISNSVRQDDERASWQACYYAGNSNDNKHACH